MFINIALPFLDKHNLKIIQSASFEINETRVFSMFPIMIWQGPCWGPWSTLRNCLKMDFYCTISFGNVYKGYTYCCWYPSTYFMKWNMSYQVSISPTCYGQLLRQYFCAKKLQSQNVSRKRWWRYWKCSCKMMMKLTTDDQIIKLWFKKLGSCHRPPWQH